MSRKHYIAIAKVFRFRLSQADTPEAQYILKLLADDIADFLQADNTNFDRRRFLEACHGN